MSEHVAFTRSMRKCNDEQIRVSTTPPAHRIPKIDIRLYQLFPGESEYVSTGRGMVLQARLAENVAYAILDAVAALKKAEAQ